MKTKMFKAISLVLSLLVIVSLAAGCGAQNKPSETSGSAVTENSTAAETSAPAEPAKPAVSATLKLVFPGDAPPAQDQVNKAVSEACLKDGLDLKFEYTYVPWDAYWNKLNLIAAGGEEQDLAWTHITTIGGQVAAKVLSPLDDALNNYGQELKKSISTLAFKEVTYDGKIYAIPRVVPQADNNSNFVIRADLRKKYGLAPLKTIEDMEAYAAAVAKNEQGMKGIGLNVDQIMRGIANYWFWGANAQLWAIAIDPADPNSKVMNYLETPEFQQFADKTRQYQKNGWLFGGDYDMANYLNDLYNGKTAMLNSGIMRPSEIIDGFKAAQPNGELEWVQLYPDKPTYQFTANDNLLAVFSTSKHVNESVAFVNWIRTNQANYDLMSCGVKDVNYKLDGESVSVDGIAKESQYAPLSWTWTDVRFMRFSKNLGQDYIDMVKNWDSHAVVAPTAGFSFDPAPVKTEVAKVQAVATEYSRIVMFGLKDFSSYKAELLKKMKDAGIDKVIAEMQKQVDAYKAANK